MEGCVNATHEIHKTQKLDCKVYWFQLQYKKNGMLYHNRAHCTLQWEFCCDYFMTVLSSQMFLISSLSGAYTSGFSAQLGGQLALTLGLSFRHLW